jgi:hypothetical protein
MIDTTLGFVVDELNSFLTARFSDTEPLVVLSSLSAMDGSALPGLERKLIVTLVNISEEAALSAFGIPTPAAGGAYVRDAVPLHMNLYVMMSASFGNYMEALTILSCVLCYFQARPMFDAHNSANFPSNLDKLSCELVNISTQELNNLWTILGSRYLPSALYKLRMVTRQQDGLDAVVPRALQGNR